MKDLAAGSTAHRGRLHTGACSRDAGSSTVISLDDCMTPTLLCSLSSKGLKCTPSRAVFSWAQRSRMTCTTEPSQRLTANNSTALDLLGQASRGIKRSRSPESYQAGGPPGSAGDDGMLCLPGCVAPCFAGMRQRYRVISRRNCGCDTNPEHRRPITNLDGGHDR
jgi:hypothetical protein